MLSKRVVRNAGLKLKNWGHLWYTWVYCLLYKNSFDISNALASLVGRSSRIQSRKKGRVLKFNDDGAENEDVNVWLCKSQTLVKSCAHYI